MADITLTNPTVNGGTPVRLNGVSFSYSWKNTNKKPSVPNNTAPVEVQTQSWQPPLINISGVIDVDSLGSNEMSEKLLKDFARVRYDGTSSTKTTLTIPLGSTPTYFTAYDSTTNSLNVVVEDFSVNGSAGDSNRVHFLNYSITLSESG